jgi:flavin reductase (DIM6/NTAB) family NADH-FMN oxidoreductase RutF
MDHHAASSLFQRLDRELWVVTAQAGARRGGLIATFVNQASIVPEIPRMIVGIARQHHTWGLIEASGAFALHLLREEEREWVWRFGLQSGHDVDKLDGLATRRGASGAPILTAAPGWVDCRVEARLDTGDRTVYLAEVLEAQAPGAVELLTVSRLRQLMPGEWRGAMLEQLRRDAAIDAQAIATWRSSTLPPRGGG